MIDQDFMKVILNHECGEATGTCEFSADECVADDVELDQKKSEQNGDVIYKSTCDYTMITPKNQTESSENVFDYSGS